MNRTAFLIAVLGTCFLLPVQAADPPAIALQVRPGLWRMVITVDQDAPQSEQTCVGSQDPRHFLEPFHKDMPGCRLNVLQNTGRQLHAAIQCATPDGTRVLMDVVLNVTDPESLEGSSRVTLQMPRSTVEHSGARLTAKRVGTCKP